MEEINGIQNLNEEDLEQVTGGKGISYIIQPGDTLIKIAHRYNTTVEKLCKLNKISDQNFIVAGKKIRIN